MVGDLVGENDGNTVGRIVGENVVGIRVGAITVSGVKLYKAGDKVPAPSSPYGSLPVHTISPAVLRMHAK